MKTSWAGYFVRWLIVMGAARCLAAAPADVDSLARQLRDPAIDANGKGDVCLQLMDLGPAAAPAVAALVGLLTAPEEMLRDYAVTTLDRIGPPARNALPALRRVAAQDSSPEIRGLARAAIAKISGTAAESEPAKAPAPAVQENTARTAPVLQAAPENVTAPTPAVQAAPVVPAAKPPARPPRSAMTIKRPILAVHQGRYYRWATPAGWTESESANGVTLTAPDGLASVSAALLLNSPGPTNPVDLTLWILRMIPENGAVQVLGTRDLPDQPGGSGVAWKVQEIELQYAVSGIPMRAIWTTGVMAVSGASNAFLLGYQAPPAKFDSAKLWLAAIARTVVMTNPVQMVGSGPTLTPRNQPLDNPALLEYWSQKGLSEYRISQAQREGTMGYERMKDAQTGRLYEMPLEAWDDAAGGYHNPQRPKEILQPAAPGE
jgi:hypothetical protein